MVDPKQCGLLDVMIQTDLLTDTDIESLSGRDVYIRKDQVGTRRTCLFSTSFTVSVFFCVCLPVSVALIVCLSVRLSEGSKSSSANDRFNLGEAKV